MKLNETQQAAFDKMKDGVGIGAATAAYYSHLGPEYLTDLKLLELFDVYEE